MVSLPVWSVGQVANISMGRGSQSQRQDDIFRQSNMLGSGRFQPKIVYGVRSTDTEYLRRHCDLVKNAASGSIFTFKPAQS
jgi:hypothetical protein